MANGIGGVWIGAVAPLRWTALKEPDGQLQEAVADELRMREMLGIKVHVESRLLRQSRAVIAMRHQLL